MTLKQGIDLINQYTPIQPKNLKLFLNWISITENSFHYLIDQHRNKKIWQRNENWEWERLNNTIPKNIDQNNFSMLDSISNHSDFMITKSKRPDYLDDHYILIGKGYYN
jgi:hypothetical protein